MKWVEKYPISVMGTAEGFGAKSITVKLKDGREYCKEVIIAKGMPLNPLTPDEFNSKYRDCASTVLSKEDVERSLFILDNLEKMELPALGELIEIMAKNNLRR